MGRVTGYGSQSHPYYVAGAANPRHNPTYVERVAAVLLEHWGEAVHLEAVVGGDPWVLHEAVELLRDCGFHVLSERGRPGYTLVGWTQPRKWLRRVEACRRHVAALALRPPRRGVPPPPDQLRIVT